MKTYLSIIRPQQWVKNLFVFLPSFFGGRLFVVEELRTLVWAFVAFCLVSSAIYCLNDIRDVEADREHPTKRRRPLASGAMSVGAAWVVFIVLLLAVVSICWWRFAMVPAAYWTVGAYLLLNVAYSYGLKRLAIVDVFVIALGFVLRIVMGGVVCDIWLSPWIVCLTFLLALFLAFAKRRDDVLIMEDNGRVSRRSILNYNISFMNQTLGLLAAVTMVCYIIYSVSPDVEARLHSEYVYVSSIFVLAGILRYLQLSLVEQKSGSPTRAFLTDRFLLLCVGCWVAFFIFVLYV